jgi:hypothetical protein
VGEVEGPVRTEVLTMPEEVLAERPGVVAARHEARNARLALGEELERLEASARAAVDIKAKMRREPVKTAGMIAGVGFLAVGGPRRVLRRTRNMIFGKPAPLPDSMLPHEINKALSELGTDGDRVRGTIEREFAAYLHEKAPERRSQVLARQLTSLGGTVARPVALRAGFELARKLFSPDGAGYESQLERLQGRRPPELVGEVGVEPTRPSRDTGS